MIRQDSIATVGNRLKRLKTTQLRQKQRAWSTNICICSAMMLIYAFMLLLPIRTFMNCKKCRPVGLPSMTAINEVRKQIRQKEYVASARQNKSLTRLDLANCGNTRCRHKLKVE